MINFKTTVYVWAHQWADGDITYMVTACDMTDCGYIKVGSVDVDQDIDEPDFDAVNELSSKRDELIARQKAELAEFNSQASGAL